eukprot:2339518-Prymnesium_polylepis.1
MLLAGAGQSRAWGKSVLAEGEDRGEQARVKSQISDLGIRIPKKRAETERTEENGDAPHGCPGSRSVGRAAAGFGHSHHWRFFFLTNETGFRERTRVEGRLFA